MATNWPKSSRATTIFHRICFAKPMPKPSKIWKILKKQWKQKNKLATAPIPEKFIPDLGERSCVIVKNVSLTVIRCRHLVHQLMTQFKVLLLVQLTKKSSAVIKSNSCPRREISASSRRDGNIPTSHTEDRSAVATELPMITSVFRWSKKSVGRADHLAQNRMALKNRLGKLFGKLNLHFCSNARLFFFGMHSQNCKEIKSLGIGYGYEWRFWIPKIVQIYKWICKGLSENWTACVWWRIFR